MCHFFGTALLKGDPVDFYKIKTRNPKKGITEVYPAFVVQRSNDLMVRGKSFYAIWDEEQQLWSTNEDDVPRLIDKELMEYRDENEGYHTGHMSVKTLRDFDSNSWKHYRDFLNNMYDNYHVLDNNLVFRDTVVKKNDYVSKRLPYPLEEGSHVVWDELIGTLYDDEERQKIEWAIGAIVSGDAKEIQKFLVIYGEAGAGKSTILSIIQKLFEGYYTTFEAKELTSSSNSFSTESFKGNPLVAIQHDGDLSRIEDNSKLNAIVSHEEMRMNEKYKPSYSAKVNCFLFMGTNKPVKITDGKSGLIRRLIDVKTSGRKIPVQRYQTLVSQIDFELGAIAHHCLDVYKSLGKHYYSGYVPLDMMFKTDIFFNFVESYYYEFLKEDMVTLSRAYELYKTFCDESSIDRKMPRYKFRDELKNYFSEFLDRTRIEGDPNPVRSVYRGFQKERFLSTRERVADDETPLSLVLDSNTSIFDVVAKDYPAQLASKETELPTTKWSNVITKLSDIDTQELHYVQVPKNHIVIDFDIKDDTGEKSLELNLVEASKFVPTYAEYSKSGKGIHLHYIYDGDVSKLSPIWSDGVEIKVFNGDASLRRKFSKCNTNQIAHINSGLPLKGEKMYDAKAIASEKGLRELILRNLHKEIHPGTKPSIDFINTILDEAYESGMKYDITQMRPQILSFASKSTNQSDYCVKLVSKMKFKSEDVEPLGDPAQDLSDEGLVFYDVEVLPNLFVISWKYKGPNQKVVRMINPEPSEIEDLLQKKLVGFNCRRYDNHILYARFIGYTIPQLFELSSKIVSNNGQNAYFREAYNLSFADIYDFSSIKQSLKAFQIQLGIHHKELGLPWDQPVPKERWLEVASYCDNDVISSEVVFDDRKQDFVARQILAELSGLSINDTTQQHTAKIIFGNDKRPQDKFVYTDLSETFPGYKFDFGKSSYRGEDPKEGGYVYSEPGIYEDVALLDIASMHPSSIINMNMFGPYTQRYKELHDARIAIKHKNYDEARQMLGGILSKYLDDPKDADDLAYALKIHALNIVYGLTSAKFDNKFKDPRNIDNIVAKRGALFMIDLKHAVQEKGFTVAHIKTDSIKIPHATEEIISFVHEFGKKYGYTFEHEATYSKFCLVNDAVYIAKYKDGAHAGEWTATGAQFAHPVVFKTLFSKEELSFKDLCESKAVTGASALYLDMNEDLEDVSAYEKELAKRNRTTTSKPRLDKSLSHLSDDELKERIQKGHNYQFVGKVGLFCPVKSGVGGGLLVREKEGKYYAATGTKGYRWLEAEDVDDLKIEELIDPTYRNSLIEAAIEQVSNFGNFKEFVSA